MSRRVVATQSLSRSIGAGGVVLAAVVLGVLVSRSPRLVFAAAALSAVALVTWRWPQAVPAVLLAGPGFLHLFTATVRVGATRADVLGSPLTFLPVLAALFGPAVWKGLNNARGNRWAAVAAGTAGRCLLIGMLFLLTLLVLRFPGTPAPTYGATKIIGFTAYSVLPVILLFVVFRGEQDAQKILDALLVIGAAWLGLSLMIAISHGNLDLYRADPSELLGGTNQAAGGLGGRAVPVALVALASATRSSRWRPFRIALGMVGIIVLLLSGHRGSILSFAAGLTVLLVLTYRRIYFRQVVAGVLAIAVLALVGWWTLQHAPHEVLVRYQNPLDSQSVSERLALQRDAVAGWLESPIIGNGTGASAFLGTASDQPSFGVVNGIYPHNVTIELLAELGIIGAGVYLVTIAGTFVRALRTRRATMSADSWALIAAASCTAAAFIFSQVDADLTIQNELWIMSGILALAATSSVAPAARSGVRAKRSTRSA